MDTLWQDLRFGFRTLLKNRGLTAVAVITLALGIGANTAIFSVLNSVLLRPLPFEKPEDLISVYQAAQNGLIGAVSFPDFFDWRQQNHSFDEMAVFKSSTVALTGDGPPEQLIGMNVSADFFSTLGVKPIQGRTFRPEEEKPGSQPVVLLSYELWQRRFRGDSSIINQSVTLNGVAHTVIGILPPDSTSALVGDVEIWRTIAFEGGMLSSRGGRAASVIARLRPGVTLAQARSDMDVIAQRLAHDYPSTNSPGAIGLISLQESLVGGVSSALWMLFGVVAFVLLIACANVANLLLARASARQREVALRMALGAVRGRIIRQLLTESLLLALIGGASGLVLGYWGIKVLIALNPGMLPRFNPIQIDARVLGFTLLAATLTGIVFGLAPAVKASSSNLNETLNEGGRTGMPGGQRLRSTLVIAEVALAFVLLIGAGLLLKSFLKLRDVDPGFNPANVLTMRVSLPVARYKTSQERTAFFQEAIEKSKAVPGVQSAGLINFLPFSGSGFVTDFSIAGRSDETTTAQLRVVSPGYFGTMEIPIIRGRSFDQGDNRTVTGVAIINNGAARRYWPNQDPIGQTIKIDVISNDDDFTECRIVGIVGDVHRVLAAMTGPEIYVPYAQRSSTSASLVIRTKKDPLSLVNPIRSQILSVDKDQPVYQIRPLESMIAQSISLPRFYTVLLGVFASVGLVLALVGIYGVLSYTVTESTREIGIRMALGAQRRDVFKLILGQGMVLVLLGGGIGLGGAWALSRVIESLLFDTAKTDPVTFSLVSALVVLVALAACYLPARRATKVDPIIALRYE